MKHNHIYPFERCIQFIHLFVIRLCGSVFCIGMYQIREANQMVEEFMLAANVSVAEQILKQFPSCSLLR